jgi:(S)-sulfolactate dehydrogenase
MPDIIITEFMDPKAVEETAKSYDVHYDSQLVDKPDELKTLLANARGLVVRNRTRVDAELLEAAPNLKVVGRLGVGLDNIDLKVCEARGVTVCPATGANDAAVAEWVIATVMLLLRGAFLLTTQMLNGDWPRTEAMGHETAGKTLGLVGFGRIARHTARLARALGMQVVAYDPFVSADDNCWKTISRIDELFVLLQTADIVSLHVPLLESTRHLIDDKAIAQMKKGAILVNASRGGVLDENALVAAMKSGRLRGAALDVFENEPLTASSAAKFAELPNLILTPHIGGVTIESNQRVSQATMDNVRRVLEASK